METPSTTLLANDASSVILTVKIFFLVFIRNMLFQIVPISSCPSLGITEKKTPSSLHLPFRYLYIFMRYPLNFLFTMLNSSISHNFPLCKRCPSPLVTVMGLHWSLLCGSMISLVVHFFKLPLNLTTGFLLYLHIVPRP